MKQNTFFFLAGIMISVSIIYGATQRSLPFFIIRAIVVIHPTQGNNVTGIVTFHEQKNGTHVHAQLHGLTPGKHGFHIHDLGNCSSTDGMCTKGHFNPTNQPHGGLNSKHRHVGDMGNIIADEQGNATLNFLDKIITLNGPHTIIGRSIIVHADEDDLVSQPTGNAGDRVGCGVIGIAEEKK